MSAETSNNTESVVPQNPTQLQPSASLPTVNTQSVPTSALVTETENAGDSAEAHAAAGSTLEDFQCAICMDPLIDPAVANCGHRFCTFCLANWFEQRGRKNCPSCRAAINELRPLPDVAEKIERLVEAEYTTDQKEEREEAKNSRNNSQLMQRLGSSPLQNLLSRNYSENQFEFDLPIFEFDDEFADDGIFSPNAAGGPPHVVNLTATTIYNGDPSINPWLPYFQGALPDTRPNALQGPDSRYLEVESLLDDFEIRLRQSQLAFRSLMDNLTTIDPYGIYFRRIEDRFRSLGLIVENERLVTSFPSQEVVTSRPTNFDRENESSNRPSRPAPPHPSDWYFINRNRSRSRRGNLLLMTQEEWNNLNYSRNHPHYHPLQRSELWFARNEERPIHDRDSGNTFQNEPSQRQNHGGTTPPEREYPRQRNLSYNAQTDFMERPHFAVMDSAFDFYNEGLHSFYDIGPEPSRENIFDQPLNAPPDFSNHAAANSQNVRVLQTDNTETLNWFELEESESNLNAEEFQPSREALDEPVRIIEGTFRVLDNHQELEEGEQVQIVVGGEATINYCGDHRQH